MKRNDEDKKNGLDTEWIFPIFMTIVFWPVGIFLLMKKYRKTLQAGKQNSFKSMISGGVLMSIIGLFFLTEDPSLISALVFLGGACLTAFSGLANRRNSHLYSYLAIIADRPLVDIVELSETTGRNQRRVIRDLEQMIKLGMLPETAYVDHGMNCLVLDPEEMRRTRAQRKHAPVVKAEVVEAEFVKPAAQTAQAPAAEAPKDQNQTEILRETFDAKLREIRYLNDLIDDEAVSARIDDIENITANIFYLVQEKPERMEEIRTFMNYYLPTTFKLLNAYARLEKQGVSGGNISHTKKEIEQILDKLVEGFRQQLDRLFQSDAIDISSDIDVLETMMARDGLLEDGLKMTR